MKASELRIGNYINDNFNKVREVEHLNKEYITSKDNVIVLYNSCDPIPLTEDWLVRFGFVLNGFKQYEISINPFDDGIKKLFFLGDYLYLAEGLQIPDLDIITIWNKDLKKEFYVHQLQNLFFVLTGEDLELKNG